MHGQTAASRLDVVATPAGWGGDRVDPSILANFPKKVGVEKEKLLQKHYTLEFTVQLIYRAPY